MLPTEDFRTIRDLIDCQAEARPDCDFLLSPETGQGLTFRHCGIRSVSCAGCFKAWGWRTAIRSPS